MRCVEQNKDNAVQEIPNPIEGVGMSNDTNIKNKKHFFYVEEIILVCMLLLALLGVWITDYAPVDGYGYWMIMVFVFAILSITLAWLQRKTEGCKFMTILREQSLHWLTSMLLMEGIYTLFTTNHLTSEDAGLVIMMILSQSTILDGVRIGWRFALVGIFLGITAMIAVYSQHFFWIGAILAVCIVISSIFGQLWLNKNK